MYLVASAASFTAMHSPESFVAESILLLCFASSKLAMMMLSAFCACRLLHHIERAVFEPFFFFTIKLVIVFKTRSGKKRKEEQSLLENGAWLNLGSIRSYLLIDVPSILVVTSTASSSQ